MQKIKIILLCCFLFGICMSFTTGCKKSEKDITSSTSLSDTLISSSKEEDESASSQKNASQAQNSSSKNNDVKTSMVQSGSELDESVATVNVHDFGAKGDGKTNDTNSIQRAIDKAAELGGGYVFFPVGTYLVSKITVSQNICLYSNRSWSKENLTNKGSTVISPYDNNSTCIVDLNATGKSKNVSIRNLCIDGKGKGSSMAGIACPKMEEVFGSSMRVQDVRIMNCSGIGIDTSHNAIVSIRGCAITGCNKGIFVQGWDVFICNNLIAGNKSDGVYVSRGSAMSFCYNQVGWNDSCGIRFNGFLRASINGNTFECNAGPGIYASDSVNLAISQNLYKGNATNSDKNLNKAKANISITSSSGINITDNTFQSGSLGCPEMSIDGEYLTDCIINENKFDKAVTGKNIGIDKDTCLDCIIKN